MYSMQSDYFRGTSSPTWGYETSVLYVHDIVLLSSKDQTGYSAICAVVAKEIRLASQRTRQRCISFSITSCTFRKPIGEPHEFWCCFRRMGRISLARTEQRYPCTHVLSSHQSGYMQEHCNRVGCVQVRSDLAFNTHPFSTKKYPDRPRREPGMHKRSSLRIIPN